MPKQGAKFRFTRAMEATVREILRGLAAPPILVLPDYDAVADKFRPFRLYCYADRDGIGATLEQSQQHGFVLPILFISRATLDSERSWPPLGLEDGSIVQAIKRLHSHHGSTKFAIYSDFKALENIAKVGEYNAHVQRWLEALPACTYKLEYRKGLANGNADFVSRPLQPAINADDTGHQLPDQH